MALKRRLIGLSCAVIACMLSLGIVSSAAALEVVVVGEKGQPLSLAMVSARTYPEYKPDASDEGYPARDKDFTIPVERNAFTFAGKLTIKTDDFPAQVTLRVRLPGFKDANVGPFSQDGTAQITMIEETDPLQLAMAKPANTWIGTFALEDDLDTKRFRMQCGFCHQQGSIPLRMITTEAQWEAAIARMIPYGARLATRVQKELPTKLAAHNQDLLANPDKVPDPLPWQTHLTGAVIETWPAGDIYSQMHDMLIHDGIAYVGDNTQDRLWIIDPITHKARIRVTPHEPDDPLGGLIASRLKTFPKRTDYTALHSLAISPVDGHFFMTASNKRLIIEFDPKTEKMTEIELSEGFYPHTIRVDNKDRVWFTLALSNQIGMYDRKSKKFTAIDLPSRSLRESLTLALIPYLFKLSDWGVPISKLPIDDISTGVPLPYGIDISPTDGTIWVARLHANDIAKLNPDTLEFEMITAPFVGPRRLRVDAAGNPWIGSFGEGAVFRLNPANNEFDRFDMPTLPKGSDTPYALTVDRKRNIVWATGTASDTLNAYHVDQNKWEVYPLPRTMTFTREIEVAPDGSVFTSNGAFPAWHTEDGKPTLLRVIPAWAEGGLSGH